MNTRVIILRGSRGRFFLLNMGGRAAGSFTVGLENGQKKRWFDNGTKNKKKQRLGILRAVFFYDK